MVNINLNLAGNGQMIGGSNNGTQDKYQKIDGATTGSDYFRVGGTDNFYEVTGWRGDNNATDIIEAGGLRNHILINASDNGDNTKVLLDGASGDWERKADTGDGVTHYHNTKTDTDVDIKDLKKNENIQFSETSDADASELTSSDPLNGQMTLISGQDQPVIQGGSADNDYVRILKNTGDVQINGEGTHDEQGGNDTYEISGDNKKVVISDEKGSNHFVLDGAAESWKTFKAGDDDADKKDGFTHYHNQDTGADVYIKTNAESNISFSAKAAEKPKDTTDTTTTTPPVVGADKTTATTTQDQTTTDAAPAAPALTDAQITQILLTLLAPALNPMQSAPALQPGLMNPGAATAGLNPAGFNMAGAGFANPAMNYNVAAFNPAGAGFNMGGMNAAAGFNPGGAPAMDPTGGFNAASLLG